MDYSVNVKYAELLGRLDPDLVTPNKEVQHSGEWGVMIITPPQGERASVQPPNIIALHLHVFNLHHCVLRRVSFSNIL